MTISIKAFSKSPRVSFSCYIFRVLSTVLSTSHCSRQTKYTYSYLCRSPTEKQVYPRGAAPDLFKDTFSGKVGFGIMQSKPLLTQCPKSNISPLRVSLSSLKVKNLVLYFTLLLTYSFHHLPGTLPCILNNMVNRWTWSWPSWNYRFMIILC